MGKTLASILLSPNTNSNILEKKHFILWSGLTDISVFCLPLFDVSINAKLLQHIANALECTASVVSQIQHVFSARWPHGEMLFYLQHVVIVLAVGQKMVKDPWSQGKCVVC